MPSVVDMLKRSTKWIEYAYVVVLLTALTQGPVFKLWFASAKVSETPIFETYRLTFIAVQIPALMLLGYRIKSSRLHMVSVVLLAGFVSWMWLSTLWATSGRDTIMEATVLVMTAATGLYIARSFSHIQQMLLVCIAMQPGVILSYIAVKRNWEFAVSIEGHWVGIYFNRNSLAPVAAAGMIATLGLLWIVVLRRYKRWWPTLVFILGDVALVDGYVLSRTRSSTSVGAVVVFGLVWVFWSVIRMLHRRKILTLNVVRRYVYSSFVVVASISTWVIFKFQETVLRWLGEEDFFNGRAAIWHYGWTGFLERPIIGWGWMSAWKSSVFLKRDLWWTVEGAQFSHSAYIDVLLGGGIIGAVLLFVVLVYGGFSQIESVLSSTAGQWAYAMTFFVLLASTQESFVNGNHFLWLLLVASVIGRENSMTELRTDTVTTHQEATS
ncbi:MAG: O-antigen ligase family protein [Ilumatobacteraceae bacterium]